MEVTLTRMDNYASSQLDVSSQLPLHTQMRAFLPVAIDLQRRLGNIAAEAPLVSDLPRLP